VDRVAIVSDQPLSRARLEKLAADDAEMRVESGLPLVPERVSDLRDQHRGLFPAREVPGGHGVQWKATAFGGIAAALKGVSEELPYTTVHAIITQISEVDSRIAYIMDGSSREGEVLNPGRRAAEKAQELLAAIQAWEQAMADYAATI
jgi:hypothetical protein